MSDAYPDGGLLAPICAGSAAESATGDVAYLQAMLDAEVALVRAQARLGLAPESAAEAVARCAAASRYQPRDLALRARESGNPVIPLVTALRQAVGGEAADWVHRGATSQDIVDTASMLIARRVLDVTVADLRRAMAAAARLAETYRDVPAVGRTLTQHAAPTTFGARVAGWLSGLLAAYQRLVAVRRSLPAQLGGAVGTLAAQPGQPVAVLEAYAAECGLACPVAPWHTVRTPVAELASALMLATGACGKLALDVTVLSQTEIGEVAESGAGGSSTMPHKTNPVRATLLVAAARQAPALGSVLHTALLAEQERPAGAWHAEWQPLRDLLRLAGSAAQHTADLLDNLVIDRDALRRNLELTGGLVAAERVAFALVSQLGRAAAHQAVRRASQHAAARRTTLREALAEQPDVAGVLHSEALDELCDPAGYVGAATEFVDCVLRQHRDVCAEAS